MQHHTKPCSCIYVGLCKSGTLYRDNFSRKNITLLDHSIQKPTKPYQTLTKPFRTIPYHIIINNVPRKKADGECLGRSVSFPTGGPYPPPATATHCPRWGQNQPEPVLERPGGVLRYPDLQQPAPAFRHQGGGGKLR